MDFPQMADRLPAGERGVAKVSHFEVSESASRLTYMRRDGVDPGRYARLCVAGRLMMTDTQMERRSNRPIVRAANGDVLIAGLGLGMILDPIAAKDDVRSITVVEKFRDVIELVGPHFAGPKLSVVEGDIFEWKPERGRLFDVIYFDIWPDLTTDNLAEMAKLHRRFARHLNRDNPLAWMGSWQRDELKSRRRRQQREERRWRY